MNEVYTSAFGNDFWGGKIFLNFSVVVGDDIAGSSDVKLTVGEARILIGQLVDAINEVEAREGK